MKQRVPITVIIPTYNRKSVLVDTVNSFLQGDVIPAEFIVVDQSNPSIVLADVLDVEKWNIQLVHSEIPSLTKARNAGIKQSNNDIILFADDDILVDKNTVKVFHEHMANKQTALCAGMSIGDQKQKSTRAKQVIGTFMGMQCFWKKGGYVVRHTMRGRYSVTAKRKIYQTEWAMGYFFGVKRSLLEKWSVYFDENLIRYAYAEDLDFTMRYCKCAREEKMSCVLDTSIYVNHLVSQEWRTPSQDALFFLVANRMYLLQKNFPNYSRWFMRWNNFCYTMMLPNEAKAIFCDVKSICKNNSKQIREGNIATVLAAKRPT